jgi:hypothetical protein
MELNCVALILSCALRALQVSWGYSGGSESVEYVAGTQTAVGVYAEKKEGLQTVCCYCPTPT